jgi:hypothetical protein
MRAPVLDQPFIAVAGSHVEKVDRYHRDDRPIRTVEKYPHDGEGVTGAPLRPDRPMFKNVTLLLGERRPGHAG